MPRIYLPSSAPPPEQPQAEEVEAVEEQPEPESAESKQVLLEEPVPSPVGARPGVRDPKEAWVEYAQTQGWTGDPEETSKKSLIEQYGQQEQQEP